MDVNKHKNVENVIRYYLGFLPPRDVKSILDIGGGLNATYKGVLKSRCIKYGNLDIRHSWKVDFVYDMTKGTPFKDNEWEWGWCSEVIEHMPKKQQQTFVAEALRICKNVVFTYPDPTHESFHDDPGHIEVEVNWDNYKDRFFITDKSTKSGRHIIILSTEELIVTKKGIAYKKERVKNIDNWM